MRSRIHLGQIVAPTVEKDEAVPRKIGQVDRTCTKMSTATVRTGGPGALADAHRRQTPRRAGSGSGRYLLLVQRCRGLLGAGLVIAIVAGFVLGRLRVEKWVEPFVFETRLSGQVIDPSTGLTWDDRIQMGVEEVGVILRKIWPYLLVGIALGAAIHGWAPEDFFTQYAGAGNPFAVLIAVLIGVPLYSNAAGIMPLVLALHDKGLPMGTLLAFMMAVVALSLPELILLRRVLKLPLIATFVAVVSAGIIAVGYLFNAVIPL